MRYIVLWRQAPDRLFRAVARAETLPADDECDGLTVISLIAVRIAVFHGYFVMMVMATAPSAAAHVEIRPVPGGRGIWALENDMACRRRAGPALLSDAMWNALSPRQL